MDPAIPPVEEDSRFVRLATQPWGQAVVAGLTLVILVVFSAFPYLYHPYDGLEVYREDLFGEIYLVYQDSPAARAGVQVGDRLLAIDGKALDATREAPRYPPGLRPGQTLRYELQRGGQTVTLPITLGRLSENWSWLIGRLGNHLLAISLWAVGAVLTRFVPVADRRARLLGMGFLLAGCTTAVGRASGWNSFWGANTLQLILLTGLSPILVAAHLTFPTRSLEQHRRTLINGFAVLAGLLALLVGVEGWYLRPRALTLFGLTGVELRQSILIFFLLGWLTSIGLLVWNRYRSAERETRRQTGIVLWGLLLGLGPFVMLTLLPYFLWGEDFLSGGYTILALLILPLAYAYVIFQRRLLQVDLLINSLVVSGLLFGLVLLSAVLIFQVLGRLLLIPLEVSLVASLVAAVLTLPTKKVRAGLQRGVNRVLYGSHYDFASVTGDLSSRLAQTSTRETLIALLTRELGRQMGIRRYALLLAATDQLQPVGEGPVESPITMDDPVCRTLAAQASPLRVDRLGVLEAGALPESWSAYSWAHLLVPLVYEGRLQGVLLLGSRRSGEVYSAQDLRIVAAVAHQGALAAAHVQVLEQMRDLTQQLVRIEENQRKELARELHDTVLQDLFFFKQRLHQHLDNPEMGEHLSITIQRLRQLIKSQRSPLLDRGLPHALAGLVEEALKVAGPELQIDWENEVGEDLSLNDEQVTALYRIAQEAVHNALKHAQAGQISVQLGEDKEGRLSLSIQDDGGGMSEGESGLRRPDAGYGLLIMQERADMIEAELQVGTRPVGGTKVTITLPI